MEYPDAPYQSAGPRMALTLGAPFTQRDGESDHAFCQRQLQGMGLPKCDPGAVHEPDPLEARVATLEDVVRDLCSIVASGDRPSDRFWAELTKRIG